MNTIERLELLKDAIKTAKKIIVAKKAHTHLLALESELTALCINPEWIGTKRVEVLKVLQQQQERLVVFMKPLIKQIDKDFAYDYTVSQLELNEGEIELRVVRERHPDGLVKSYAGKDERYYLSLHTGLITQKSASSPKQLSNKAF